MIKTPGILTRVLQIKRGTWLSIVLSIGVVAAIIITMRTQNRHEELLILNKKHEQSRIRDSVKTAIRQERLDSLAYYRAALVLAEKQYEELLTKLKKQDEKNYSRLDSINRRLPVRPRF